MGETYYADNYEELTGHKPGEEPETDGPGVLSTGEAGAQTKVVKAPAKKTPRSGTTAETN